MRWLITARKSMDLSRLEEVIHRCGGEINHDYSPVPLGESEWVVQADGPADLPDALKANAEDVIGVYPDSEMQLY